MVEPTKAPAVELTDDVRAGISAAMDRVKELGLEAGKTSVDSISHDDWVEWDASKENAIVIDSDGLEWTEIADDAELDAA